MAVLLVDEEVEQLAGARSRGAPLVRRRQEDFPRVVREGVETVRGARRRRVRQVRRGLDDFRRVVGVDGHDVAVRDPLRGLPDLVEERKDLVRTQASLVLERLRHGLGRRLASEFGRHAIRERLEVRQFPAQHAEARGLHLGRRLRVIPEIPEGARIRSGPAESASGPFEQRVCLVERSCGREAREAERLRVPRVRGDERLDGGPCILVAELAVDDLQDLIEAAARELDKRPHARSGRTAHPPAGRVEGLPAIGGKSAHVIRLDALFNHVAEEGFEQRLREAGRFSQLEARAVRSEEFPLDWVLRRLLDSRNPGQDRLHPRLGRDEQVAGAFVDTEHERLVRPQLLPEVEHRPLGFGPRGQHSTVVIAGRQLRMRPTRRYGSRNGEYAVHSVFVCADDRSSGAFLGGIGGRDRVAHSNLPSDKDLGAKPSPMNQPGEHASSRQAFEVGARLAQTDAAEPNVAHEKLPADEMVQRRSPRDDVPPRLARCDRKLAIAGHRLDCFGFDQGDLPPPPGPAGVRARPPEAPVALEAFPLDRADGLHGLHRVLRLRRELDRDDLAVPRGPAGHRAANCVGDLTIAYPGAARIASASISTRTCGSINRLTWSKVAAGRICWKNSACARPTFSQSSMFVTNMRVRITSSSWAPASARAASIVRKMWTAWPYASPGATTFPSGSVAVVPATATWLPKRTTREYPTIGSQRPPDATFFRSMERRIGRAAKKVAPSRGFPELDVRRDLRQPGRDRAFRMLQEVRQFVRGLFGDRGRVFPSAELPPAPFLERFQGSGQLAPEGVVSRPIVDRRDNDEFPADRDDPQTLLTHCGDGIAGGQGDARFDEVPDDGQN